MVIILVNMCAVRIAVLKVIIARAPTVQSVARVYPITWVCAALCLLAYYASGRWTRGRR